MSRTEERNRRIAAEQIRNLGIIAHVDAGKTTLTERVLYYCGRTHALGEVHDGTARTDHHPIEQRKGITIMAAAVTCDWRGHRVHLIDTPGHVDFTIEVERSLRVLDGAICVLDGVAGVEPQTQTVWRQADRHGVPRLCFVNKLDRAGADFERCLRELEERLGAHPVALAWPVYEDDSLIGVVDLVDPGLLRWSGGDGTTFTREALAPDLAERLSGQRQRLLELAADEDPRVLEAVVNGQEVEAAQLYAALRKATISGRVVPVLCGAAGRNLGVQPLLDAAVALLPCPLDREPVRGIEPYDNERRPPSRTAPLCALAFKVVFDDHSQLSFVRVYSGALKKGDTVMDTRTGKTLRVGRLCRLHADEREDVDRLEAGEIGAILGGAVASGDTLADPRAPLALEALRVPEPVLRVVVEPQKSADWDRLTLALGRMHGADPSLRVEVDGETGQTLLCGMGQLHLDIAVERLALEHGVDVRAGQPRVAYRTTLTGRARRDVRHVKQSGGPGQFAHVVVDIGPAERGAGLRFVDQVRGGVIPRGFIAAVELGVREAMQRGLLGGHPVMDVECVLLDGSTHPKDSSELAFKIAGARAFQEAAAEAGPVLLEPIVALEVQSPEAHVGAVMADLSRRRGQILDRDVRGREHTLRAEAPLGEVFGYAGALSALTHGLGRFTQQPSRYERAPAHLIPRAAPR